MVPPAAARLKASQNTMTATPPAKPQTLKQMRDAGWGADTHGFTIEQAFVLMGAMADVINFKEDEIDRLLNKIHRLRVRLAQRMGGFPSLVVVVVVVVVLVLVLVVLVLVVVVGGQAAMKDKIFKRRSRQLRKGSSRSRHLLKGSIRSSRLKSRSRWARRARRATTTLSMQVYASRSSLLLRSCSPCKHHASRSSLLRSRSPCKHRVRAATARATILTKLLRLTFE